MMLIKDYDGVKHRVSKVGIDFVVTLCDTYIKPDQWMSYPGWESVAAAPPDLCGACSG